MTSAQRIAVADFRRLHNEGCFVLPNPWDVGTAIYLRHLGFKALATTSAGYAFSRGKPDGAVPRDEMLLHIGEVVAATPLPVNADFLNGFADEPEQVAANVTRCIGTGVAGLSIEDSTGRKDPPLYDENLAVDRLRAARAAIDASQSQVVLTGRCEAFLVRQADPLRTALARLVAYAEAGADCLYAPGLIEPEEIAAVVRAVAPKPVNVLVSGFNSQLSLAQLAGLGVRRISVGSGLALTAWGAFLRGAREIATEGSFKILAEGARTAELNDLFSKQKKRPNNNMFAPADYVLRPLAADDEPLLWEMLYQALSPAGAEAPSREIMQRPEYARYVQGWGRPTDRGYVAHDKNEGTLLGAVWLRAPVENHPGEAPPELAFVVRAGHRHRGIGASLLTQMVRANPNLSAILLQVGANSPAVRLFEKFGFEVASQSAQSVVMRRAI